MSRIVAIALNTFREAIRNKILYSLLFFAILLIVSALAIGQLSLHEDARIARDLGLAGISLFGVLIAIFIGVNLTYVELERKTIYSVIPKPIRRHEFILGKFGGMLLTLLVQVLMMSAVLFGVLFLQRQGASGGVVRAIVLLFVEMTVMTSVAVLFSSFSKPFLSGLFTFGLFLVGRSTPELRELIKMLPRGAAQATFGTLLRLLPDLHLFYVSGSMVDGRMVSIHDTYVDWGYVGTASAYGGLYTACTLGLACVLFSRRDFT